MARAAVKAKQAQQAQAQAAAKPARKQRKHAAGGNPNQDLFFSRLRRRQKWVFVGLAIVFAISFTAIGVGSGNGVNLGDLFNSIAGGGDDAVGKAKAEIKDGKVIGYKDLAAAYIANHDTNAAAKTLEQYLRKQRKDSLAWTQLGSLKKQQADVYGQQYQEVSQVLELESPSTIFNPGGKLANKLGSNPIDDYYRQKYQAMLGPLYQKATTGYRDSLAAYQQAAKVASRAELPNAEYNVYLAARAASQGDVALKALKRYVQLVPNSPNLKQLEAVCKDLGGSCAPKHKKS
ncbi:MAG: hypothetical protein QOG85_1704 [Gaiellaceae bacterium]|jgi:hypothetical protein|nr:hypothetical protein [Gaiellaceae bacterium]